MLLSPETLSNRVSYLCGTPKDFYLHLDSQISSLQEIESSLRSELQHQAVHLRPNELAVIKANHYYYLIATLSRQ